MFVVVARYYSREGRDDEVAGVLGRMAPIANAEPGCVLYVVNRSLDDPRRFLLYEQYVDRAAFDAHVETEAVRELVLGQVVPLLEHREREIFSVVGPG